MKIDLDPIASGHILRGWLGEQDGTPDSGADIDLVAVIRKCGDGWGEVCAAKGKLTAVAIHEIGRKAYEYGYRHLTFHRTETVRKLSWAALQRTEGGFDFYAVELPGVPA